VKGIEKTILRFTFAVVCAFFSPLAIAAQSADVSFPTAVTTSEIDGKIKARDIGDPRLTSYFYTFDGGQGDMFINVVTKNLNGDIDVFATEGMRPLTKMVIYADAGENETGRLVYLRKPERLILRVEGRSPNDDPATFRIRFGGSFVALAGEKSSEAPKIKDSEVDVEAGIRVNSVGTIVEVIPKPPPPVKEKTVEKEAAVAGKKASEPVTKPAASVSKPVKKPVKEGDSTAKVTTKSSPKPPITSPAAKNAVPKKETEPKAKSTARSNASEVRTIFNSSARSKKKPAAENAPKKPSAPPTESKPNPLASIRLVIQLKDGKTIERPMSEVTKFSVDNGMLTVIAKDGSTVKYSILDVARFSME
jgi:hypothetical protein